MEWFFWILYLAAPIFALWLAWSYLDLPKRKKKVFVGHRHNFVLDKNNREEDHYIHWACLINGTVCTEVRWARASFNHHTLKNRRPRTGFYVYIRGRYREWHS